MDMELAPPRKECFVCADKPSVTVALNPATMTVKAFEEKLLKASLNFVAPDVNLDDGSGSFIISSEAGELSHLAEKTLGELKVLNGTRLIVDDFLQQYELRVTVKTNEKMVGDEFSLLTDVSMLKAENGAKVEEEKNEEKEEGMDEDQIIEVLPVLKRPAESADDEPPAKAVKIA